MVHCGHPAPTSAETHDDSLVDEPQLELPGLPPDYVS
jgi:hypothetical protein